MPIKLSYLASLAALALFCPERAHACSLDASVPMCTPTSVILADGTVLPPGVPALPIIVGAGSEFVVNDALGGTVPTRLDTAAAGALLVFTTPLAADSEYRLTYLERCPDQTQPEQSQGTLKNIAFRTSAAVPPAVSLGTLSFELEHGPTDLVDSCGTATGQKEATVAELVLRTSDDLKPWLSLLTLTASVEGSSFGAGRALGTLRANEDELEVADLTAYCDGSGNLKPSPAKVIVRGRLVGATEDLPALSIDIDLTCPTVIERQDGGASDAGAPTLKPKDDGCAVAGSGSRGLGLPLSLAAALLLWRRRKLSA